MSERPDIEAVGERPTITRSRFVWTRGVLACGVPPAVLWASVMALVNPGQREYWEAFLAYFSCFPLWLLGGYLSGAAMWRLTASQHRRCKASALRAWLATAPEGGAVPDLGLECLSCGYLLTGLMESRCPECGMDINFDEILCDLQR